MNNAIYAAATGMITRSNALNVIGNNLTNANTSGYKKEILLSSEFGSQLLYKLGSSVTELGTTSHGVLGSDVYTQFNQEGMTETSRSLDLAINGAGFFTLTLADGTTALTRDGQFSIDNEGYLVGANGAYVTGQNGKIKITDDNFTVSAGGKIYSGGSLVDTLRITNPENTDAMTKTSNGLYSYNGGTTEFAGKIVQGAIENSNVNVSDEMVNLIAESRAFQSCSQVVKQLDEMMEKTVNEIGRMG